MRVLVLLSAISVVACTPADQREADIDETASTADTAGGAPVEEGSEDAVVPGTDYNAAAQIPCGVNGTIDATCEAGVKRDWDDKGGSLVEVTKPGGMKRAIFFNAQGKPMGADSSEADGSAGWEFVTKREDDWNVIEYGPEFYRIPDAFVLGG